MTGYRYVRHLYCLAVQAGFYSDVVECKTLSPADRVRFPVGENIISILHAFVVLLYQIILHVGANILPFVKIVFMSYLSC